MKLVATRISAVLMLRPLGRGISPYEEDEACSTGGRPTGHEQREKPHARSGRGVASPYTGGRCREHPTAS
jgi:hypothetical protein